MATYTTEGLVLKSLDYQEADRILTVFTKNFGKVSVLAKGVRRMESRKGGNVDQLNYVLISLAESGGMYIVTEVEALSSFRRLKEELSLAVLGYYVAELIDKFFHGQSENYRIFRMLLMTLNRLDHRTTMLRKMLALRHFEMCLLDELGYRPELRICPHCGGSLRGNEYLFQASQGGVVCPSCARSRRLEGFSLPVSSLDLLRKIQGASWTDIKRLRVGDNEVAQVGQLLKYYLEWLLERKIGSHELLADIASLTSERSVPDFNPVAGSVTSR